MKKFTNLLIALLALFGTVISARADAITLGGMIRNTVSTIWPVILVIVVIIVTLNLLRIFRKK